MAVGSGTTTLGIHYLLPGEAPDLAGITQQQAGDVDALFTPLKADTGWLSITTVNSPYTASALSYRIRFNELMIRGTLNKGSTVVVGDTPFTLPTGAFPTTTSVYRIPFMSSSSAMGMLSLNGTNGVVNVAAIVGTGSLVIPTSQKIPLD